MILNVKMLGDGSGRACIHWLVESDKGPIETQERFAITQLGPIKLGGVKGYIACNPQQNTVNPQNRGGETLMCMHTNEVRAATCPKCLATPEAVALLKHYAEHLETAAVAAG